MTSSPLALQPIFGPIEIRKLVQDFDFSKVDARDTKKEDYLHVRLAPTYSSLDSKSVKALDENTKIMIAGVVRTINGMDSSKRNWKTVEDVLIQNPLVEADGPVDRDDKFTRERNVFLAGSDRNQVIKQVEDWFSKLVRDQEVLGSAKIDTSVIARIVAQSGLTVDVLEASRPTHEYTEKPMVDIGVLQFPNSDHSYFKIYHIRLVVWIDRIRILMITKDSNGITGGFHSRIFKPRKATIDTMKPDTRKKAVAEAEALFA